MATIYRGTGWSSSCVGETRNGTVYSGTGWSSDAIGEYKDGTNLSRHRLVCKGHLANIEIGAIYLGNRASLYRNRLLQGRDNLSRYKLV